MDSSKLIRMASPILGPEERELVLQCLDDGWISSQGKFVGEFERLFAEYVGATCGVAVCNGTAALSLALHVLGLRPGDEVLVPTLTFGATANVVRLAGGIPRFVGSDMQYWQMDPADVSRSVTSKTRGIIVVHLYGHPVDLDPIMDVARQHGLWVIEDAAEAHGAAYRERRVGALADIGCFSFYANKIITTGEGGMCVTNNQDHAQRMQIARDHGMLPTRRYWHAEVGANYRMTNLQAAIGVAQMGKITQFVRMKRQIAAQYQKLLSHLGEQGLVLQAEAPWASSVYWMYNVILPRWVDRDAVMSIMAQKNVETRTFFSPLHLMPAFADCPRSLAAQQIEQLPSRGLTLPSGADLKDSEVECVAHTLEFAIRQGLGQAQ